MNSSKLSADNRYINNTLNLKSLKGYYDVPESEFPLLPVVLSCKQHPKEKAGTELDVYASQRTRDNIDEY